MPYLEVALTVADFTVLAVAVELVGAAGLDGDGGGVCGGLGEDGNAVGEVDGAGLGLGGVVLLVVVAVGVGLDVEEPAVGEFGAEADVLEVGGDVVEVVRRVVGLGGVGVLEQVLVAVGGDLGAGGAFGVGGVGVDELDAGEAGEGGAVGDFELVLDRAGAALLGVPGLEAVGGEVVDVEEDGGVVGLRAEVAGVELDVGEDRVEGAVGDAAAEVHDGGEIAGEEVDGAAEGGGPDGGGGAGAAVEVDAADPRGGKEGPGVVGGGVGVLEGDAVEVDVVVPVGEAAEVGFGVAEADAVGVDGEGSGGHLEDFGEVGDG